VKITRVTATPVNVPFVAPYRFTRGSIASVTHTIVEVDTDEGISGVGEVADGDRAGVIEELGERLVGLDPYALNACEVRCASGLSYSLWANRLALTRAFGGIEMALWDIKGKAEGRALHDLLGGAIRAEIPFTEYFAPRHRRNGHGGESTPAELAAYCAKMIDEYDAPTFEGKVGGADLDTDVEVVRQVRAAIGESRMLRLDANCAWTLTTAREAIRRLTEFAVRNIEDPVLTLDEMAKLRQHTSISFSTHQPDLAQAVKLGAPDFIVLNLVELGGIRRTVQFIEACELLGVGFWFHSGETSVGSAGYLQVAAALEPVREPSQALFHWVSDDVTEQGPFCPHGGVIPVPTAPGLGVTLDRKGLQRCHQRFRDEGEYPGGPGDLPHPGRVRRR
jgi:glucarate dehydratase